MDESLNISFASEKKQRTLANDLVGDNITAEKGAFSFTVDKGEEIREAPFVYCTNLMPRVADTIHNHERYTRIQTLGGGGVEERAWYRPLEHALNLSPFRIEAVGYV